MAARKPLEPGCDGGILCTVPGHVGGRRYASGRSRFGHIPLTLGQHKTLRERRIADREAAKA